MSKFAKVCLDPLACLMQIDHYLAPIYMGVLVFGAAVAVVVLTCTAGVVAGCVVGVGLAAALIAGGIMGARQTGRNMYREPERYYEHGDH